MKSLVTVQNLYRRGKIFGSRESGMQKEARIEGIKEGNITLDGESFDMTIADTLSRFTLLYDVPFSYLVPEERMLPEESIRFFSLDSLWIKSFLDGALSVGRNTEYDFIQDARMIDSVYQLAVKNNMQVRRNLGDRRRSPEFDENYGKISEEINTDTEYSGFLLRSSLVRDFEGLELQGFTAKNGMEERLLAARIDRLSPEGLLGIFCGKLTRLLLGQPPEGVHLGFINNEKRLRRKTDGTLVNDEIGNQAHIIKIWEQGEESRKKGVIRYSKVAQRMKGKMVLSENPQENESMKKGWLPDSSDMALQLIQNALTGEFLLEEGSDGTT